MIAHLISVDQFTKRAIETLFNEASSLANRRPVGALLPGTVGANLFYEPSTRTSSSFYAAMVQLGGSMIPINDVSFSSVSKGETLEDTIRVMGCYCDVIVLRHPTVGAARRAAEVSTVPIINGGDGVGEHPTQALLDLYTIHQHRGLENARVALVGDLLHGRTIHSLIKLLRLYHAEIHLVSPEGLDLPEELLQPGDHVHRDLDACISSVDVVYMTRLQKERILDPGLVSARYQLTLDHMARARQDMIVMHPLPRVDEIPREIDQDPRAAYFRQVANGVLVRKAIFSLMLNDAAPWSSIGGD
jgi:aspartate carbamoyltransferase